MLFATRPFATPDQAVVHDVKNPEVILTVPYHVHWYCYFAVVVVP